MMRLLLLLFITCALTERNLYDNSKPGQSDVTFGDFKDFTRDAPANGSDLCPCVGEAKIKTHSLENSTASALAGYGTCSWETTCTLLDSNSKECSLQKCVVDVANCELGYEAIDGTKNLAYSYNTCGFGTPNQLENLEGKTLKVMLVPENQETFYGDLSCSCRSNIENYPSGCSGLVMVLVHNLQAIAKFDVEWVNILPDQFWTRVKDFCQEYEHPGWGTDSFQPADDYTYKSHLCKLQIWTVCAYAASLGYVDWCPANTAPSEERVGWVNGLEYMPMWTNLYKKTETPKSTFESVYQIFAIWNYQLYIILACWVVLNSFLLRLTSNYYIGFWEHKEISLVGKFWYEFCDLLWSGWGMFIGMSYPQTLPTPSAKLIVLIFKFCHLILAASITASLTSLLLSKEPTTIDHITDMNAKGQYLCFEQEINQIVFESTFPQYAPGGEQEVQLKYFFTIEELNAAEECGMIYYSNNQFQTAQGQGMLCNYQFSESLGSNNHFSPVNERVYDALNDAYMVYKAKYYNHDHHRILQNAIRPPACEAPEATFETLTIMPFLGLVKIFGIAIVVCVVFFLFILPYHRDGEIKKF